MLAHPHGPLGETIVGEPDADGLFAFGRSTIVEAVHPEELVGTPLGESRIGALLELPSDFELPVLQWLGQPASYLR